MSLFYKLMSFDELTTRQLYALGQLRQAVFVVEQNCPYLDLDGKDTECYHLLGIDNQANIVAYCRILPPNVSYPKDVSIGRVATAMSVRGTGAGRALMVNALNHCNRLFGDTAIRISAQTYLVKFYASLGFVSTGKEYLEDDIPHTEMILLK